MKIGDVPANLDQLKRQLSILFKDAEFITAKELEGIVKQRIFNEGLDSSGKKIGTYSPIYARYRERRGRQTSYVDLSLTQQLEHSIHTGKQNDMSVVGIVAGNRIDKKEKVKKGFKKQKRITKETSSEPTYQISNAELSEELDNRYGLIFAPSEAEKTEARKIMIGYIEGKLKEIIK